MSSLQIVTNMKYMDLDLVIDILKNSKKSKKEHNCWGQFCHAVEYVEEAWVINLLFTDEGW